MGEQSRQNNITLNPVPVIDSTGGLQSLPPDYRRSYFDERTNKSPHVPVSKVSPALTKSSVGIHSFDAASGTFVGDPVRNIDGSSTYFVLTAGHVVSDIKNGEEVAIKTADGSLYPAAASYRDLKSDLAVIMVTTPRGTPPLQTAKVTPISGADPKTLVATVPFAENEGEIMAEGGKAVITQRNQTYTFDDNIRRESVSSRALDAARKIWGSTVEPITSVAAESGSSGGGYYGQDGKLVGVHVGTSHKDDPARTEDTKVNGGVDVDNASWFVPVTQQQVNGIITQVRSGGPTVTQYKQTRGP